MLQPGTRLGSYEITSLLGSGGMGEVYRAKDLKLGRDVAIKVLREELAADPDRLRRFEQEARSASALNHPNIITIYEIGKHGETPYIAMEFVEGKTLREVLAEGPLPTKKLLQLATQIAEGLAKAHSAGIIHRDLKPENLMVSSDGYVKILDFGLAKLMPETVDYGSEETTMTKELTRAGVILGTIGYMSPEQASGRPLDHRSDQFSFGSILYEMATGQHAFRKDTMPQTLAAIIEDEPEPIRKLNEEIPVELAAITKRCLAKEPSQRYESTEELVRELKNVPEALTGWRAHRRILWSAAALVVTLIVLALGPSLGRLWQRVSPSAAPSLIDSIAVLPLQNLSGDPEQEYFTDGMTEALITDLAKIGALKVISRSSVMRYKGTDKPLAEIAGELNVDVVVEGSALRVGESVRIMAQLIDPATEQALWAESYEQDLENVLMLWSEVAQAIAGEVRVALTPEETKRLAGARPVDPEAHDAYLKGSYHWPRLTPEDIDTAERYFELALAKDPSYAPAYAGLAMVWACRQQMGLVLPHEAGPRANAAALRALELDSTLAEAHYAVGTVRTYVDWDWQDGETAFRRAIALNPSYADARASYSHLLIITRRPDEALTQMERAVELDPFNPMIRSFYGMDLYFVRRYDDCIAQCQEVLRTVPNHMLALAGLWYAFYEKGMYEESLAAAKALYAAVGDPQAVEALERGYAEGGYQGAMSLAAETLAASSEKAIALTVDTAILYIFAGLNDRALEWLERCFEARDPNVPYIGIRPEFDPLRDHPRFQDLLRRMNLPVQ